MSNFSDIGNLMRLYLDEIEPGNRTDAPSFLITATAQVLNQSSDRNWVPVIVKETGEDQYKVIGNAFMYAVAEEAGLEKVWCIIADDSEETEKIVQVLSREVTPKINLSKATRDEIKDALQYLIEKPGSLLKGVNLLTATSRIDAAPRQYWKTLDPITKLKCKITKKNLEDLEEVFYLTPQPMPEVLSQPMPEVLSQPMPEAIIDPDNLDALTVKDLKEMAKKHQLKGYSKMKKHELIELLTV